MGTPVNEFNYQEKPLDIEEAFRLIAQTPIGRSVLKKFLILYATGKIILIEATPEQLGSSAASFVYEKGEKKVYYQNNLELGLLAPLLFHEIVHSTDEDYVKSLPIQEKLWMEFLNKSHDILMGASRRLNKNPFAIQKTELNLTEIDEIERLKDSSKRHDQVKLFIAERKAYTELYYFIKELKNNVQSYSDYIDKLKEKGYCFHRQITDEEIIEGYHLNPKYV